MKSAAEWCHEMERIIYIPMHFFKRIIGSFLHFSKGIFASKIHFSNRYIKTPFLENTLYAADTDKERFTCSLVNTPRAARDGRLFCLLVNRYLFPCDRGTPLVTTHLLYVPAMPSRPPSSLARAFHTISFVPFPDACVRPIKRVVPRQGLQPVKKTIPIQLKTNPIKKIFKKILPLCPLIQKFWLLYGWNTRHTTGPKEHGTGQTKERI